MSDTMEAVEQALGHVFTDRAWLVVALTHPSYANEQGGPHNERLEFLGDAVLQATTTDWLLDAFPEAREGALSWVRAKLVSAATLAELARELQLGPALRLGIGEDASGGRSNDNVLANAMEAVLGAIYRDAGFEACQGLVRRWLAPRLARLSGGWKHPKSRLQELTQERWGSTPHYDETYRDGPAHEPVVGVRVRVGDRTLAQGEGRSRKEAERRAAEGALAVLEEGP